MQTEQDKKRATLTQQAVSAFHSGDLKAAERLFKKAASAPLSTAQTVYNYAVFLRQTARLQEAAYWLERCLKAEPGRESAGLELAQIKIDLGEHATALTLLAALPCNADRLRAEGLAHFALGDWLAAFEALDSIDLATTDDLMLLLRVCLELGDMHQADRISRDILKRDSSRMPDVLKARTRRTHGAMQLREEALVEGLTAS